jgi:hypothetical protein
MNMGVCDSGVDFFLDSPEDGVIKLLRNLAPTLQPARPDVSKENLDEVGNSVRFSRLLCH